MKALLLLGLFWLVHCSGGSSVPIPTPIPKPPVKILHCSQVVTSSACNSQSYNNEYCEWQNNQCAKITQCSDIVNQSDCDGAPQAFAGCIWLPSSKTCFKPTPGICPTLTSETSCSANTSCSWSLQNNKCVTLCKATADLATCNAIPWCYWDSTDPACGVISECSQISGPSFKDKCDGFNSSPTFCQWSLQNTCIPITNCVSVENKTQCDQHTYSSEYCGWNSVCFAMATCPAAITQTDCAYLKTRLDCDWNWVTQKCASENTQCGQVLDQSTCESSSLKCQWSNNLCQNITTCSSIVDTAVCNLNQGTDGYCYLNQSVCQAATGCSAFATKTQCLVVKTPLGSTPACFWDTAANPAACERTTIQQCSQIKDSSACEASSLNCQWSSNTCASFPTSCSAINNSADCSSTSKHSYLCEWSGNACNSITGCTNYQVANDCNGSGLSCSWDSWTAQPIQKPTIMTSVPAGQVCISSASPTSCSQIIDPTKCATSSSPYCYWQNQCTTENRTCRKTINCSQYSTILSCPTPECEFNLPNCEDAQSYSCSGIIRANCDTTNGCQWE